MRICLFTPNFYPDVGGAERDADAVAAGLTQRGHDVTVLTRKQKQPPPTLPYRVVLYRKWPKQDLWPEVLGWPLWRAHRRHRFDVILAFYSYPTGYAAVRARGCLKCPIVLCPQGGDLYPKFHALKKRRVPGAIATGYREADRIITISKWLGDRIHTITDGQVPPMDLVYNGIDLQAHDTALAQARKTVRPLLDQPFVLHLARIAPVKQQHLAIKAIDQTRELFEQHKWRYAIVGDGESFADIQRMIEDRKLGHIVQMLGTRTGPERDWLYANAQAFITTSREEGMPNVVVEAMASGLPMVASDIGPHQEAVADHGWGLLFRSGDSDDLAVKLRELFAIDRQAMADAAMRRREAFSLKQMIDGYENSLQTAIQEFAKA